MNPTTPTTPTAPVAEGDDEQQNAAKNAKDAKTAKSADIANTEQRDGTGSTEDAAPRLDKAPASDTGLDQDTDPDQDTGPDQDADLEQELDDEATKESSRLAAAGAGIVSVGLGIVSLSGAWSGRVAAERETLIGQIKTSSGGSAGQQISEIYGDAWHATALVNGLFGLVALLVGSYVLVRPAFGQPSVHPQAGWVRAVAKGGIVLGALGVLIAVAMYFDLIVALPTAPAAPAG
ncbi:MULTISPECIES: hypothetical protein [unclassified Streptomyces]|uniref:hypothetical protein n=1 Tax=unclassified Streptomyces TaxID=2593676 RepID=UPI002DD8976A|nr:hypothetical protein [Streptomyces sp. NBC_01257]WRZ67519.1 hypothetical protein OG408_28140 [Streptomyces sp. NBC_01257]